MSIETAIIKALDLAGDPSLRNRGPAREALNTLRYLISEFEAHGNIDRVNMAHAYASAAKLGAALELADMIIEEVGNPVRIKEHADTLAIVEGAAGRLARSPETALLAGAIVRAIGQHRAETLTKTLLAAE
jgi:hypothetical protein